MNYSESCITNYQIYFYKYACMLAEDTLMLVTAFNIVFGEYFASDY